MSCFLLFVFMKLHQRSKTLSSVAFILKELIQNAEDAGASEVKFMYDETEYGVESLWSPDMAEHQGEAVKKQPPSLLWNKAGQEFFKSPSLLKRQVFCHCLFGVTSL